jgi:tetraacyldisaccharide 4'-kinase
MKQITFEKLISGRQNRIIPAALRGLLRVLSWVYLPAVCLRNIGYSIGLLRIHSAHAGEDKTSDNIQHKHAVISIGNITAGGTGKTPLVIWVCQYAQSKGFSCAILTRGYKTSRGKLSDEPAILTKNCPQARVIVNPDRVAAARKAITVHGSQVLILDDGFQHRRLARDLDIITVDATRPFGFDCLLPAGLLREPLSQIKRADAVVITRSDQVSESEIADIENRIREFSPDICLATGVHRPVCVKSFANQETSLDELKQKKVFAFCGIGNPRAFLTTLTRLGITVTGSAIYDDHHDYTDDDLNSICRLASEAGADLILTTEKDWNKTALQASGREDMPLAYLIVRFQFTTGRDGINGLIDALLPGRIVANTQA